MKHRLLGIAGTCAILLVGAGQIARAQLFERTDPQREIELGRQVALEVERILPLSRDPAMQERVRRIGWALARALPERAYPYEFKTLEVRDFNAFCLPGGFMYVYEGLLAALNDDDAVAFVMAHEITHARKRHWHEMTEKMKGPSIVGILAGAVLGAWDVTQAALGLLAAQYSRDHEYEADKGGIELMWAAGFDPQGALRAARQIAELERGTAVPVYLRSHPPARDRLASLEVMAQRLQETPRPTVPEAVNGASAQEVLTTLEKSLPATEPSECPWIPLRIGNRWEYAIYSATHGPDRSVMYSVHVVGRAETSRGTVWRVVRQMPGGLTVTQQWYATAEALWTRHWEGNQDKPWIKEAVFGSTNGNASTTSSITMGERVEVPCGAFENTLRVTSGAGEDAVETWYVPGVGMVKRVSKGGRVVEVLVKCRLARTPADEVPVLTSEAR